MNEDLQQGYCDDDGDLGTKPRPVNVFSVGREGIQRNLVRYTCPPASRPLDVCFTLPYHQDLTHSILLRAVRETLHAAAAIRDAIGEDQLRNAVRSIQFVDRNVMLETTEQLDFWVVTLANEEAVRELLRNGIVLTLDRRRIRPRRYNIVLQEEYDTYMQWVRFNERDKTQTVSSLLDSLEKKPVASAQPVEKQETKTETERLTEMVEKTFTQAAVSLAPIREDGLQSADAAVTEMANNDERMRKKLCQVPSYRSRRVLQAFGAKAPVTTLTTEASLASGVRSAPLLPQIKNMAPTSVPPTSSPPMPTGARRRSAPVVNIKARHPPVIRLSLSPQPSTSTLNEEAADNDEATKNTVA